MGKDVKNVLSPALFELAKLSGGKRKPITLKDDSALAFLVQSNEELMEKHKLKIVGRGALQNLLHLLRKFTAWILACSLDGNLERR